MTTVLINPVDMRGGKFKHEHKDCTVRALMILLAMSYSAAHAIACLHGRPIYDGGPRCRWARTFIDKMNRRFGPSVVIRGRMTVEKFVKWNQDGRYFLWVNGHAFALIDGVAFDQKPVKPKQRLLYVWRFPEL